MAAAVLGLLGHLEAQTDVAPVASRLPVVFYGQCLVGNMEDLWKKYKEKKIWNIYRKKNMEKNRPL